MDFRPVRIVWISWSLIWAASWAVLAVLSVHRYPCRTVLVYTVKGQQCAGAVPGGNLDLVIIFAVLALASVAGAFIPAGLGKIRRHLAARHQPPCSANA
jgi:hypothetical protein